MKKTDLYRSIDGIKPDDCLKEQILKAAEENDVVTVIKRPVFVPVMITLLLCLNVGMVAKLVIFNKSQVNMSEFRARTSMSSAADTDEIDSEMNELQKELEEQEAEKQLQLKLEEEKLKIQQEAEKERLEYQKAKFEEAKIEFLEFLESSPHIYSEMQLSGDTPIEELPSYLLDDMSYQENEKNNYCRYVFVVDYPEISTTGGEFYTSTYAVTNYEYIIGYDGAGFDDDNIVSITRSRAQPTKVTEDMIISAYEMVNSSESQAKINALARQKIDEFERPADTESYTILNSCYCFFKDSGDSPQIVFKMIEPIHCYDGSDENIVFYVDENGEDVTYMVESSSMTYWTQTVYSPYIESETTKNVTVPDVTGMSIQDAQEAIEAAGLKSTSRYYVPPNCMDFEFDKVCETYPEKGEVVVEGTDVQLSVCARMMPYIYGYSFDDAKEMLEKMGLKVKVEYLDGVDPDSDELYVGHYLPYASEAVPEGEEVTLYLYDESFNEKIKGLNADQDNDTD